MGEQSIILQVFVLEDDPDDRLLLLHDFSGTSLPITLNCLIRVDEYLAVMNQQLSGPEEPLPCLVLINIFPFEKFTEAVEPIRAVSKNHPRHFIGGMMDSSWEASINDLEQWGLVGLIVKPVTPSKLVKLIKESEHPVLASIDLEGDVSSEPRDSD